VAAANGAWQPAAACNVIADDCSFIDDEPLRLLPPVGCNPIAPSLSR
jgi:hypothetical protein